MGLFKNILAKIFPASHPAVAAGGTTATLGTGAAAATAAAPTVPTAPAAPAASSTTAASAATPAAAPVAALPPVDVEAVLEGLASRNAQKLNWRTSIVDLMKLLDMDSSLKERQELADELKYPGDKSDSAAMNIWLHKAVMKALAANGGQVPASMRD